MLRRFIESFIKRRKPKSKYIETYETRWCPFCGSDDIFSGSWAPEKCLNCGATYMFGIWKQ